ncbi:unnamed protein product [Clonostachys rhizophaga]|uniref:Choline transport protein n=1 Tax=Clonostachys rhizophaga TaxID=160324 RepID=A0A9N9YTZ1_9HYPO|nr:unnamed protein product [Clonostachys rhizophaga]
MSSQGEADDRELEAQRYAPAMPRRFSLWSLLSLGFTLTATWNAVGITIGTSLAESSSSGAVWTLVIAALMNLTVALGMAELASAYPSSGAQYYWSYEVASPEWAPFASYVSSCVSICGWWLGLANVCNFVAAVVLAIYQLYVPEYTIHPWHQWLCYVAILCLAALLNILGMWLIPALNQCLLYFSLSTLAVTIMAILAGAYPNYQSNTWVFADAETMNKSYSKGILFILCLLNSTYGFMGSDAGAHMAEEIPSPSINVPKIIVYPIIIGLATALPFAISCMYVISDVERIVNPHSGISLLEIYHQATGSKLATSMLLGAFSICLFGCAVANITGSSRQIWAASRDNCHPMSAWLAVIHPRHQMPANAACVTVVFTAIYGLIFVGSTTAFASMVSANIVFMMASYAIPQGIVAYRGRSSVLPARNFHLGKFGLPINIISCIWVGFLAAVACVPTVRPVSVSNMNWVSAVILFITTYILLVWHFWQRQLFKGPKQRQQVEEQGLVQASGHLAEKERKTD